MNEWRSRIEKTIFVTVLGGLGITAYAQAHPAVLSFSDKPELAVTVFDVGQGDSIFIQTAEGKQILVDGGPDDTVLAKLGAAMPFGDHDLDLIVLTHPHADHVSGLVSVLRRYKVHKIFLTGINYSTPSYQAFLDEIKNQNISVEYVTGPFEFLFGGATVQALFPRTSLVGEWVDSPNDSSIVLKINQGDHKILLTGDIEEGIEQSLAKDDLDLSAEVLKVAHHGSKTSSTKEFLEAVRPDYAIISVGKNDYGHPHYEVARRLENFGARVWRTDLRGDIKITVEEGVLCVLANLGILDCASN